MTSSASKIRFPIRLKLLTLLSAVSGLVIVSYLALAVQVFTEDKTSLIYELTASHVRTLSTELQAELSKIAEKTRLLVQGHRNDAWVRSILDNDPALISFELVRLQGAAIQSLRKTTRGGTPAASWEQLGISPQALMHHHFIVRGGLLPDQTPMITVAQRVEIQGTAGEHFVLLQQKVRPLMEAITQSRLTDAYIVDSAGNVVVHRDLKKITQRASLLEIPIVQEALQSPLALQLKTFEWNHTRWIGAYSTISAGGLRVIAQIPASEVGRATMKLIWKSLLFGLLVLTVGLLLSSRIARTMTDPLRQLLKATERLARWEFGETIHVRSHDEVAVLARTFNSMTHDLKNQRHQLERQQQELELKVRERTHELETQTQKVQEAQETLIRTTRLASLGEFAGAAAHEVLNPANNINVRVEKVRKDLKTFESGDWNLLSAIAQGWKDAYAQGGTRALVSELDKPASDGSKTLGQEDLDNLTAIVAELGKKKTEWLSDCAFVTGELNRISKIVNNMRSLARVKGDLQVIDVHRPLDDTIATLEDGLHKRKIRLVKEYGVEIRDHYAICADRDELIQIFSNLLKNAIQAVVGADRRDGEIRVLTRSTESRVEIRIQDNGVGILQDHLNRIFEPDFTTKSVEEGTGLGLSISRRLVRAFHGDIEIEKTASGLGTTFLVWLPRHVLK